MSNIDRRAIRRSKRRDRVVRWLITLGGVTVIASVVAILLLIVGVTLPLFRPGQCREVARARLPMGIRPEHVVAVGIEFGADEHGGAPLASYAILRDATLAILDLRHGRLVSRNRLPSASGSDGPGAPSNRETGGALPNEASHIEAAEQHGAGRWTLLGSDGRVSLVEISVAVEGDLQGHRRITHAVTTLGEMPPDGGPKPQMALMRISQNGDLVCVRLLPDNRISIVQRVVKENLLGERTSKLERTTIEQGAVGRITAMTMDSDGQTLYAGTERGRILRWTLESEGGIAAAEIVPAFRDKRTITALAMVLGDVSLAVGDSHGEVSTWFPMGGGREARLGLAHQLGSHDSPIYRILPSQRNKSIVSVAEGGAIHIDYPTSERRLLAIPPEDGTPRRMIGYSARGNAIMDLGGQGEMVAWMIDCPHPEVSWETLFGKVLYEGYSEPTYAWQTTGGADFEPKFSLVPLLFGTIKGTFYAMLLAVPLALFAAAYTSQFTTPRLKALVKPVVETMAAIPSVVIGFLIALWLAPIIERWILAVFASFVTIPLVFVLFMVLWQLLRWSDWAKRIENGYEFLAMLPVLVAGVGLAVLLVPTLEQWLFAGNFRQWLFEAMHTRLDQRNSIIIAFGLGLAVIPIIFSIAEDSLSSVPHSLTAASMALGASRWQTLRRVILPSGSPGIFAGTMIGFGRAVGETMIVLMATGNTPILSWSPFNGMRTLSANIAVEIPESPVGGTLYRVLFLCAVLLFLLTFLLNTVAEVVRQRLRQRYGRL